MRDVLTEKSDGSYVLELIFKVLVPALPLPIWVTLRSILGISGPQFPHLYILGCSELLSLTAILYVNTAVAVLHVCLDRGGASVPRLPTDCW